MTPLSLSYFSKICTKSLAALRIRKNRQALKMSMAIKKTRLSFGLMKKHMKRLNIKFSGALKLILRSIWNAPWMLLTSVVILVTRPAVEYLSMSEKENLWMFLYMASRRLAARPVDEYAPKRADRMPKSVLKKAIKSIMPPYRKTSDMFPALIPLSMSEAVTYGISTPMMTSAVVQTGVSRAAVLYCLTCLRRVLTIGCNAFYLDKSPLGKGLDGKGATGRIRD